MKIPPVGAELLHADFREERVDMMKLTVAFLNSVNVPKTGTAGHRANGWLRNCTVNRKVAGSIPDGVTRIFQRLNPPGLTMALGSTRSLRGMSTVCK